MADGNIGFEQGDERKVDDEGQQIEYGDVARRRAKIYQKLHGNKRDDSETESVADGGLPSFLQDAADRMYPAVNNRRSWLPGIRSIAGTHVDDTTLDLVDPPSPQQPPVIPPKTKQQPF